jgi:hypothetical protein
MEIGSFWNKWPMTPRGTHAPHSGTAWPRQRKNQERQSAEPQEKRDQVKIEREAATAFQFPQPEHDRMDDPEQPEDKDGFILERN